MITSLIQDSSSGPQPRCSGSRGWTLSASFSGTDAIAVQSWRLLPHLFVHSVILARELSKSAASFHTFDPCLEKLADARSGRVPAGAKDSTVTKTSTSSIPSAGLGNYAQWDCTGIVIKAFDQMARHARVGEYPNVYTCAPNAVARLFVGIDRATFSVAVL